MEPAGPLGAEVERLDARLCLRGAVGDDDEDADVSEREEERWDCSASVSEGGA